jgi:hypothetical protein
VHGVNDVRQTEIHTAEPLVPEPSAFEIELAIEKLKRHKPPGSDRIPAEMIKVGVRTIRSEVHNLIISIWNKKKLPEQCKESIIVPIYKKGDKTECSSHRSTSLLPTTYKILSNTLPSRLTPYAKEIIWDHQREFRRNRSTPDQVFCILYSSPNNVRVIKSRKMRWAGHAARMGDRRGVYRVLVEKPGRKNHLGDPGVEGRIIFRGICRK